MRKPTGAIEISLDAWNQALFDELFPPVRELGCPTVLCCVGAIIRIIPNFVIHMWMATGDNGLAAALYGPSTVEARVGAGMPVRM